MINFKVCLNKWGKFDLLTPFCYVHLIRSIYGITLPLEKVQLLSQQLYRSGSKKSKLSKRAPEFESNNCGGLMVCLFPRVCQVFKMPRVCDQCQQSWLGWEFPSYPKNVLLILKFSALYCYCKAFDTLSNEFQLVQPFHLFRNI